MWCLGVGGRCVQCSWSVVDGTLVDIKTTNILKISINATICNHICVYFPPKDKYEDINFYQILISVLFKLSEPLNLGLYPVYPWVGFTDINSNFIVRPVCLCLHSSSAELEFCACDHALTVIINSF